MKKEFYSAENVENQEPLKLGVSVSGLPCIEINKASPETRSVIRRIIAENRIGHPDYEISHAAGAFLQGDQDGEILIEFWSGNKEAHQAFVDHLNNILSKQRAPKK